MKEQAANARMVTKLLFRLLPIQILLAAVGAVNGIVSSFFASNFVGVDAMSAVGLYSPLNMLISSVSMILVGGATQNTGIRLVFQIARDVQYQNILGLNVLTIRI